MYLLLCKSLPNWQILIVARCLHLFAGIGLYTSIWKLPIMDLPLQVVCSPTDIVSITIPLTLATIHTKKFFSSILHSSTVLESSNICPGKNTVTHLDLAWKMTECFNQEHRLQQSRICFQFQWYGSALTLLRPISQFSELSQSAFSILAQKFRGYWVEAIRLHQMWWVYRGSVIKLHQLKCLYTPYTSANQRNMNGTPCIGLSSVVFCSEIIS